MEICFISLIEDVGCINLRYLSSYIINNGHTTKLIFLPRYYSEGWTSEESYRYPFPDHILEQIEDICKTSDIIGISLMSCHFDNAVHITKYLKKLNKPIIWGGIHPTISPQECLEYADMVCVGEGERSIVELLDSIGYNERSWCVQYSCHCDYLVGLVDLKCKECKQKYYEIKGIIKNKDQLISVGKKIENLDELGSLDYDFSHQYIYYNNNILNLDIDILSKCFSSHYYRTSFSRGCVSSCSYCCNNVLTKIYGGKIQPIRWRSIDKLIEELKWSKENIKDLKYIDFCDDTFMSRSFEHIKEFSEKYKKEINLPFIVLSTPLAISYDKLKALSEAGMYNIGIGIQSVYEPVRKMYRRNETIEQINKSIEIIDKVSKENNKSIEVRYDFITDNPWGEEKDTEENIRFAMKLNKPRNIRIFSLVFYHGTELYEIAKTNGFICDELNNVYRTTQLSPKSTFMNELFKLLSMGCPNILIKFLLKFRSKSTVIFLQKFFTKTRKTSSKTTNIKKFNGKVGEVCE